MSGRAALEVPLGSYLLTVMRPGYRPIGGDFEVIRDGEFALLMTPMDDFDPSAPGQLTGTVTDAVSRRPIANAEVWVGGHRTVTTDDDGRLLLRELETGSRAIEVRMLGYDARWREFITIVPGHTTPLEIEMAERQRGTPCCALLGVAGDTSRVDLSAVRAPLRVDFDIIPAEWVEVAEVYPSLVGVPIGTRTTTMGAAWCSSGPDSADRAPCLDPTCLRRRLVTLP